MILEASDRIGGRVRKEDFGGVSVELGAGWVAGVGGKESNPVWELARKSGLRTCFSDYSNARYNIYDRRFVFQFWFLGSYSSWNWFWNYDVLWDFPILFCANKFGVSVENYFRVESRRTPTRRRLNQPFRWSGTRKQTTMAAVGLVALTCPSYLNSYRMFTPPLVFSIKVSNFHFFFFKLRLILFYFISGFLATPKLQ